MAAQTAPSGSTGAMAEIQRDIAVVKETTKLQLESQKESLQKDLQNLQSKIEQQDKRVSDINAATDRVSITLTMFAALITFLTAALGVAAWYSAGTKAKEAVQEWIRKNELELIGEGREATGRLKAVADEAGKSIQANQDEIAAAAENVKNQLQEKLAAATPRTPTPAPTPAQVYALGEQEKHLKHKPESEYTFKDWASRAWAAYAAGQFDLAANFFLEASRRPESTQAQVAESIFSRGVMLGKLGRHEEEIAIYDQIIARFGEAVEPVLLEGAARAMLYKGATLSDLNRCEEEVAILNQLIARFGEVVDPAFRDIVVGAINNLGFNLVLQAKRVWSDVGARNQLLDAARLKFDSALIRDANAPLSNCNFGYVMFLSGKRDQASEPLRRALTLGGEALYQAALKDTETDTVPEDGEFRALLDKTWSEVQGKKS